MAFQQGLSGLAISSKALDVSGNNIANASTVGFKQSQAHFADVYAASLSGGGASQVGIGASLAGVVQQFTQGNLTTTNNPLDIAINGSGFFAMSQNGSITYTRNGQFKMDKEGNIVNDNGLNLTGIMADATGTIPGKAPTDPLKVDLVTGAPRATTKSTLTANLDSRSTTPSGGASATVTGSTSTTPPNNYAWPATQVSFASPTTLDITISGVNYSVTVPAGSYTAVTAASAITKAFEDKYGTPAKLTATVVGSSGAQAIQLVTGDTGDLATITSVGGTAAQGGPQSTTQGFGFNTLSYGGGGVDILGRTSPDLTIVAGVDDALTINVGGTTYSVTIPAAVYADTGALASAINQAISTKYPSLAPLSITASNASGKLKIEAATTSGNVSTPVLGGNALLGLGVAPSQYQTVTGSALTLPVVLTAGAVGPPAVAANNVITVSITDGSGATTNTSITMTPGNYASAQALATEFNTQASVALSLPNYASASVSSTGQLVVTAGSTTLSGASPVAIAGSAATAMGFSAPSFSAVGSYPTVSSLGATRFNISDPKTYTNSTAQTVYDSLGNAHTLTYYFLKTAEPSTWEMYAYMDGVVDDQNTMTKVTFGKDGKMVTPTAGTLPKLTYSSIPQSMGANAVTISLDVTGITQYGNNFANGTLVQDGSTSGNLSGLSIGKDGVIQARYDNGTARTIGQIALHNFRNMNGLMSVGNNQWVATSDSGSDTPGYPGTGNFGVLQSAATEDSNVDLTTELVNLIVFQRNYQANAQSIKTQDQVLQTLVNLR